MSSLAARAGADLKEDWAGGGRLWSERGAQRRAQSAARSDSREAPTDGRSGSEASRGAFRAESAEQRAVSPGRPTPAPRPFGPAGALSESRLPRRAPPASMRLLTAALLLLLLALCAARVDGECPGGRLSPSRPVLGNPSARC